jgi:hypothetical protein
MPIPIQHYPDVLAQDVNAHYVAINYGPWNAMFPAGTFLNLPLDTVQAHLGDNFNREDVVNFYANTQVDNVTKFLATMIWGYAAPANGQAAGYGPYRVSQMFIDPDASSAAINGVNVHNNEGIMESYTSLDQTLHKCGPNFFSKHFYFLGKSLGINRYPLIFDDRVAAGLVKVLVPPNQLGPAFNMVNIAAKRKPVAYIAYLEYVWNEARLIGCNPDQIEHYLFTL